MDLKGKTAVVTGSTKGIGKAIAVALVRAGVKVVVSARDPGEVETVITELADMCGTDRVTGAVCDVRDYKQVSKLFENATKVFGRVDILVNNAGVGLFGSVEEMTPEDFCAVLETNLLGVYHCCHQVIPLMKKHGGGYIFNISSLAGVNAHAGMAAYNASKFGLNGFSEALMQEVRQDGIKVSYIMPGSVNTEFGGDSPSDEKSWQLQPADIAQVVMDLLRYPERSLPSRVEIRPARPPRK